MPPRLIARQLVGSSRDLGVLCVEAVSRMTLLRFQNCGQTAEDTYTCSLTSRGGSPPWSHAALNGVRLAWRQTRGFSSGVAQPEEISNDGGARISNSSDFTAGSSPLGLVPDEVDMQTHLTPQVIVERLNGFIIGQDDAKKAVAIALRNRWRRHRVPEAIKESIVPKNILMIGPTGCGKTEIARRLAQLADAPFVKVEATKFTEVGYHGRDVDTIIRDLLENSMLLVRQRLRAKAQLEVTRLVEDRLLRLLQGGGATAAEKDALRADLQAGKLEASQVEVDVSNKGSALGDAAIGGMGGQMVFDLQKMIGGGMRRERRRMAVEEARPILEADWFVCPPRYRHGQDAEVERMFPADLVVREAITLAEQDGIVFIDELDKVVSSREHGWSGGDPSSEGVQRDLLPIIEGSSVSTKHGNVNTDHILFICSGAFHSCKPSDLMAELQGRLPIRVELKALTEADFYRILTEPHFNLIRQQQMLLSTEGIDLHFTDTAIKEIAHIAAELNRSVQNIGARRLHTVLERICDEVSFNAPELAAAARREGQQRGKVVVDKAVVAQRVSALVKKPDLQRYII